MKTKGLIYRGADGSVRSSERFLSKMELSELFPRCRFVVMEIIYARKGYKAHKVKEGKKTRSKKSKNQKFLKEWVPKVYSKTRTINLY